MTESKSSSPSKTIKVYLRPLHFPALILSSLEKRTEEDVNHSDLLDFLCIPGSDSSLQGFIDRYRQIHDGSNDVFVAPDEKTLLEKLIWPLRQAKAAFTCGHYLGTIALSGMVSEMTAIVIFNTAGFSLGNDPLTPEKQKAVFGSEFEKLGQHRRVEVLTAYGLIDSALRQMFDEVRLTRRKYLHYWKTEQVSILSDAIKCYSNSASLVSSFIGQEFVDGILQISDHAKRYLHMTGVADYSQDGGQ